MIILAFELSVITLFKFGFPRKILYFIFYIKISKFLSNLKNQQFQQQRQETLYQTSFKYAFLNF